MTSPSARQPWPAAEPDDVKTGRENTDAETILSGGVSSDIRIVHAPHGSYVVKQALEKLKVAADWHADPARSSIEVRGLRTIARLLGPAHAPRVLWVDRAAHRFAMELVDPRFRNWKEELLRGNVDLLTAHAAGHLLGRLHARSSTSKAIARTFANVKPFTELRIRPFFGRVAQKNPALTAAIARTVSNIRASRMALVHGDYSPKNLLVDGADMVILDCEVAHWGDPRFDVAFCVTHLLLKSFRRGARADALRRAAVALLSAYREVGLPVLDLHLSQQIGCLLLARLDGDSPVDYLGDLDAHAVRQLATELLLDSPSDIELHIGVPGDPHT
jgi:5-methylthioribose kinase